MSAITGNNAKPVGSIFAQMNAKMEASGSSDPIEDKALSNFLARSAENAKSVNGSNNGTGLKRRGDEVGLSSREDVECEPASSAVMDGIVTDTGAGSASIFGRPEGAAEVRASLDRRGRSIFSNQVEGNQQSGPLATRVLNRKAGAGGKLEGNQTSEAASNNTSSNPFAALGSLG